MNYLKFFAIVSSVALLVSSKPISENPEDGDLFEGDIMGIEKIVKDGKTTFQIPTGSRQLWPNGNVPYVFQNKALFSTSELNNFYAGVKNLEDTTRVNGQNTITLTELDPNTPSQWPSVYIRVERSNGCSSYVGKQVLPGAQVLSLASGCLNNIGTTAHEFLHALGWFHEQSRPDRDDYVDIVYANIQPSAVSNFNKYTTSTVNVMGLPYDYDSVMHYGPTSFSTNGQPTIVPKTPGAQIGQRNTVSVLDAASAILVYGPNGAARNGNMFIEMSTIEN